MQFGPAPTKGLSDLFKTQATVTPLPSSLSLNRVALLISLGFYLIILQQQDAAATTAAVIVT